MIPKCPKQVYLNKKGNRACENGGNNSDYKIYASIAWMSSNDKWKNHGNIENWYRTLVQEEWQITKVVYGTKVIYDYPKLSLGIDSISLNIQITWKLSIQDENNVLLNENCVEKKQCINRESKSKDITI